LAVLSSCVLLLGACGSDKKSDSTTAAPTTAAAATTTAAAATTAAPTTAGAATTEAGGAATTAGGTDTTTATSGGTDTTTATSGATETTGAGAPSNATPYSSFTGAAPTNLPETIKIGVPLDLSGVGVAAVATDELDGIKLAQKEINDSGFLGPNTKIDLDVIDTKGDKQEAVKAALQLVSDKVNAVVGFTLTPSWQAAGPALTDAKIPAMSVELSGAGVVEVGDYSFRTYPNVSEIFPQSDQVFLKAYGAKTAAYIVQSDAASAAQVAAARQAAAEAAGIKTVSAQTFTSKDTDIRAQLTAIKDANPDVVFVTPNPDLDTLVYLQAAEVGITAHLIGSPDVSDAILEAAGPQMQCMAYTTVWNPLSTASANPHFLEYWKANGTGKNPTVFNAAGYSSLWAMAAGIRTADSADGTAIRDALTKMPTVATAMGDINFMNNRTADLKGTRVQIQDSKLVLWDANKPCEK
jgi:branched-chain amino acid transport system substrate-binding protein